MLLLHTQCTKSIKETCRQYFVISKPRGSSALICLSSKEDIHIFIQSKIFYMFTQYILVRSAVETSSTRTGGFSLLFFIFLLFMFHASFYMVPVPHSVRALVNYFQRSLCSSLSIKKQSLFLFYLFFSFSLVIVFL